MDRCAKALDRGSARLCCLAKDCDNPEYTQLVRALCDEGNVHLIMVRCLSVFASNALAVSCIPMPYDRYPGQTFLLSKTSTLTKDDGSCWSFICIKT